MQVSWGHGSSRCLLAMEDEEQMFASEVHIWLVTAGHGLVSTAAVPPATAS